MYSLSKRSLYYFSIFRVRVSTPALLSLSPHSSFLCLWFYDNGEATERGSSSRRFFSKTTPFECLNLVQDCFATFPPKVLLLRGMAAFRPEAGSRQASFSLATSGARGPRQCGVRGRMPPTLRVSHKAPFPLLRLLLDTRVCLCVTRGAGGGCLSRFS